MKRILIVLGLLLASPSLLLAATGGPAAPNFVIIFIDDMGYGDIGPYGATKQKTPNLDRMAKEGMKLTSFYAAPVCSVSRAQLLSGCYGARVSVPGVYPPGSKNGLNPKEFTIAERLKECGYATMCIGKWHVGDQPEFLPTKQGFDHYLGLPYSNDMLRHSKERGVPVVPLVRDDKVIQLLSNEEEDCIVSRYTDEAVRFIRESKDHPFLLYLAHSAVHTPIHPGPAFVGKSENGRFGDWVQEVDWSVGKVFETLREQKLDQNTVVVFTSDNGPWLVKGADAGNAGPLRGGKGSTWEGGMREPTIAWWPGKIAPGSVCDAVAGTIDLLPTFVSIAGGKVPAEPVIDGRDISPLLFGQTKESQREAHYYFGGYELQAVRQGPWKLALVPQHESMGKSTAPDVKPGVLRLYNLDEDIGERTSVADKNPDIVAKLKALAEKMEAEIGGKNPRARRPAGEIENAKMLYETGDDEKPGKKNGKKDRASTVEKPEATKLDSLKPGAVIRTEAAPQIGGKPFTISCAIETTQRDAIVLAHGGIGVGYALHLKAGRVAFAVRTGAGSVTEIVSPAEISGATKITASLAKDGTMTLQAGDQPAVTGKAPGLIAHQPAEDFCLGDDNAKPVATYSSPTPFRGSITALQIVAQ